jgi:hypothetical protein
MATPNRSKQGQKGPLTCRECGPEARLSVWAEYQGSIPMLWVLCLKCRRIWWAEINLSAILNQIQKPSAEPDEETEGAQGAQVEE